MKQTVLYLFLLLQAGGSFAQDIDKIITPQKVLAIEEVLAADSLMGRKPLTPGIEKAADYIAAGFKKADLNFFDTAHSYRQPFEMLRTKFISASATLDGRTISQDSIIVLSTDEQLLITDVSGYSIKTIGSQEDLVKTATGILKSHEKLLILVDTAHANNVNRLKRLKNQGFENREPAVFILCNSIPKRFHIEASQSVQRNAYANVVGVLPGKSRKDEYVIFSAHYDHLGVSKPNAAGDSIYNGANDDASGTAAVMLLAEYFAKAQNNERTIIFVAFTAEESGGFGSGYFSSVINPAKVVAMFNLEMIGTESMWGKGSAYITGFEKSNFGSILQKNLTGTSFHFEPDPYPKQNLFYRSDNARLAAVGVPAHTISSSKMDTEKFYHQPGDEMETLDVVNMAAIIKAIALSSKSIISGADTPTKIEQVK